MALVGLRGERLGHDVLGYAGESRHEGSFQSGVLQAMTLVTVGRPDCSGW